MVQGGVASAAGEMDGVHAGRAGTFDIVTPAVTNERDSRRLYSEVSAQGVEDRRMRLAVPERRRAEQYVEVVRDLGPLHVSRQIPVLPVGAESQLEAVTTHIHEDTDHIVEQLDRALRACSLNLRDDTISSCSLEPASLEESHQPRTLPLAVGGFVGRVLAMRHGMARVPLLQRRIRDPTAGFDDHRRQLGPHILSGRSRERAVPVEDDRLGRGGQ